MKVLIVLSEASNIQGTDGVTHKTGYWLEEFATPYHFLVERDVMITVATPTGKLPVPDPSSTDVDDSGVCRNWEKPEHFQYGMDLHNHLVNSDGIVSLTSLMEKGLDGYYGIFIPGGYAPMVDLYNDTSVGQALWHFHRRKLPTALFCHGTIALLSTTVTPEGFAYEGYETTCFSTSEEKETDLGKILFDDAQKLLTKSGCVYRKGDDWSSYTVRDRELITGQNTQSTMTVVSEFYDSLLEVTP